MKVIAPEKLHLSWEEVDAKIRSLCIKIAFMEWKFDRVVSIANGGKYVGQAVANFFNVPHESVRISRYDGEQKREEPIIEGELTQATGNLVIDDLVDEGKTLDLFDKHFGLQGNKVAVLYHSPGAPKTYYNEVKPMAWLVFPWEEE